MFDCALQRLEFEKSRRGSSNSKKKGKNSRGGNPDFPADSYEQWEKNSSSQPKEGHSVINSINLLPYGGQIMHRNTQIRILNSCSVDNQIQILYTVYNLYPTVAQFLKQLHEADNLTAGVILRIFASLDHKKYAQAKEIALLQLLRLKPVIDAELNGWNLFDSEDRVLMSISDLAKIRQHYECTNPICNISGETVIAFSASMVLHSPLELEEMFNNSQTNKCCEGCNKGQSSKWISWLRSGAPILLRFALVDTRDRGATEDMIPIFYNLLGERYLVKAYTVHIRDHFTTVFKHDSKMYIYDGLTHNSLKRYYTLPSGHRISTVWLMKE